MAGNDYDWQTSKTKLSQRGAYILKNGWKSDVQFFVGQDPCQQLFQAHKLILAMSSPVFEAMLFGEMAEDSTKPIVIPDIHPEAFQSLLQYIYTDEVVLQAVDKAVELCYAAKKYMLPPLVRQCTQFIWKDISPSNVCRAYEFAKLFDVPFLKDKCINAFKSYTEDVLRSPDFIDISADTLKVLLSIDEMTINSEKLVFDSALAWAKEECKRREMEPTTKNLRNVLADILYHVRFFAMTPGEFTSGPGVSGIFNDDEMLAILMNISMPGMKPLPQTLSGIRINPTKRHKCRTRYYCALSYPSCPEVHVRLAQSPVITELRLFVDRDIFFHGIVFNSQIHPSTLLGANTENAVVDFRKSSLVTSPSFEEKILQLTSSAAVQPASDEGYSENLLLQLCSAESETLVEIRFCKNVNWDEKVEVTVEQPYLIRRHTGYVLRVTFGSVGSYKRYTELMGPSENDGIHITCSYVNGFLVAVHTIIFSRADIPQTTLRSTSCLNLYPSRHLSSLSPPNTNGHASS